MGRQVLRGNKKAEDGIRRRLKAKEDKEGGFFNES